MALKRSFAPVVDEHTRLLVLGSLPGDVSLAQCEYYGHRQNRFWMLMAEITGADLLSLSYQARLQSLLERGVGLWDVVAQADRDGSLDTDIRNHVHNDLIGLLVNLPSLSTIVFNGGTAARIGLKSLGDYANQYRIVKLPSSSPAYTLPYSEKLAAWLTLKDNLRS
jgi:hypoxanthine-DNA glycosylase